MECRLIQKLLNVLDTSRNLRFKMVISCHLVIEFDS